MEKQNKPTWEVQQSQEGIITEAEWEENQPSFYDLAEQNGTLMYYQYDSEGNDISAEDY
ncbi:MAG: hypothetical protein AABY22_32085 [Nanoarchaeota archaeon]